MELTRDLLYPLGYISTAAFGIRFLIQWITSEIKKESTTPKLFWQISLFGNCALLIHSIIQMQYHVSLVQTCNALISWRNLNLFNRDEKHASLKTVFTFLGLALSLTTLTFYLQQPNSFSEWFRTPAHWSTLDTEKSSFLWHLVGTVGLLLFSSRFWIQWWCIEKKQKSYLGPAFWWLSLIGATLNIVYFSKIGDSVNLLGNAAGIAPYLRNLMLLSGKKTQPEGRV